jgi:hypothetical protein
LPCIYLAVDQRAVHVEENCGYVLDCCHAEQFTLAAMPIIDSTLQCHAHTSTISASAPGRAGRRRR